MEKIMHDMFASIPPGLEDKLIKATIIIVIALLLATVGGTIIRSISKTLISHNSKRRSLSKRDSEKRVKTLTGVIMNIWRIIVIFGAILYLATLIFSDKVISSVFTSAGFLGVALAFGAQSLVKDFISGMFIVSESQFRVGDVVEIDGFSGTVERIGSRSTVLRDVNGNVHFFPNGTIEHVMNKTMGFSKARLTLSVLPDTDIDKAVEVINDIGEKMAQDEDWKNKIIDAPKYIMTSGISANAIDLIISSKVQPADQWGVTSELRLRILEAFEKKGIALSLGGSATATVVSGNAPQPKKAATRSRTKK